MFNHLLKYNCSVEDAKLMIIYSYLNKNDIVNKIDFSQNAAKSNINDIKIVPITFNNFIRKNSFITEVSL